jgi:hypothetical protein
MSFKKMPVMHMLCQYVCKKNYSNTGLKYAADALDSFEDTDSLCKTKTFTLANLAPARTSSADWPAPSAMRLCFV